MEAFGKMTMNPHRLQPDDKTSELWKLYTSRDLLKISRNP